MNIKYSLVKTKNKLFDKKAIDYWESVKIKLMAASRAIGLVATTEQDEVLEAQPVVTSGMAVSLEQPVRLNRAREVNELERISININETLRNSRTRLIELRSQPEYLKEIHLTSDGEWKMFPEFFNQETGKTEYGPNDGSAYIEDKENLNDYTSDKGRYRFNGKPEKFKVDVKLPYTRDAGAKIKDSIKEYQIKATETLREYRKQRQTISSMDKELSAGLQIMQGMPSDFRPTYKVYAGGGYGNTSEDGRFGNERYFIHMEKGTFVKLSKVGKLRRCFEAKKPRTKDPHVGVEIEFVSKFNKFELAQRLFENDVHEFVQIVQDDSLRPEGDFKFTHELTVLAPENLIHMVLERVLRAINTDNGSRVAHRCGLHVHLDMRYRDRKRAFNNLIKAQAIMYAMNPASRITGIKADGKTKDTVYSKKLDIADIDQAISSLSAMGGREARYYGINPLALDRHQTIEVRIHSGSTNFEKISNWVKILTAVVNDERLVKEELTTPEAFCKHYKLNDEMLAYMKARIAKFKDKSGKHITVEEVA